MAEQKKNDAQQQNMYDGQQAGTQQPAAAQQAGTQGNAPAPAAPAPAAPAPAPSTAGAAKSNDPNEGLIKIQQGLPQQLRVLQECFTAPYKTFVQNGKSIQDLQRECNFAAQAMLDNPYLIDCAKAYPEHFVNALKNVVLTGMTLNPTLKLAYLVPFKGKVQLQASYMGKKSFGINTGLVLDIEAYLVYKGEEFEFEQGSNAHIKHVPNPWGKHDKKDILGGYYFIKYPNGTTQFDTMSIAEIEGIRLRSPSVGKGKSSPWDTDYAEMCKKTLINRAYKQIPKQKMSEHAREALEILNRVDEQASKDINFGLKQKSDDFDEAEEV